MKFLGSIFCLLGFACMAKAQFYYLDLIVTNQTNKNFELLNKADIRKITANSYDGDEKSEDFVLEQVVSSDKKQLTTRSSSINAEESYFISNFNSGRLSHTLDSSKNAINVVDYTYDSDGKLINIFNTSKDFDGTFANTESHIWYYDSKGVPEKMLKIRNEKDTTIVTFLSDEYGNIAEEKWFKRNTLIENYYYYYNVKNHLTDIVRYSGRAQKLLPDYMFEYDNNNRLTQMIQTQGGIANYLIWKYAYNDNGLKSIEYVYSKNKTLLGRVEYKYR